MTAAPAISERRQRELRRAYHLPRTVEPAGWALLDDIDRKARAEKTARLKALSARRKSGPRAS